MVNSILIFTTVCFVFQSSALKSSVQGLFNKLQKRDSKKKVCFYNLQITDNSLLYLRLFL